MKLFLLKIWCRICGHEWRQDRSKISTIRYQHYQCERCNKKITFTQDFGD